MISASHSITKDRCYGCTTDALEPQRVFVSETIKTSWKRWDPAGLGKWEDLNRTKEKGRCFRVRAWPVLPSG